MPPEERMMRNLNPMCEVFPRIASCDYIRQLTKLKYFWLIIKLFLSNFRFGAGGHQEKKNALCILGLNMINDKIFLIIWFWYFLLVFIGLFRLVFRIGTIVSWKFRSIVMLINFDINSFNFRYLLIKWKIRRYFRKDENDRHIHHYIKHCSQVEFSS